FLFGGKGRSHVRNGLRPRLAVVLIHLRSLQYRHYSKSRRPGRFGGTIVTCRNSEVFHRQAVDDLANLCTTATVMCITSATLWITRVPGTSSPEDAVPFHMKPASFQRFPVTSRHLSCSS